MANPMGIDGRSANRFNLNINPQYGAKHQGATAPKTDLRDRYSVEASAKRMGFSSMSQYQNFMWEARMRQDQVQQAADKQAMQDTVNGIGSIVKGISDIISLF